MVSKCVQWLAGMTSKASPMKVRGCYAMSTSVSLLTGLGSMLRVSGCLKVDSTDTCVTDLACQ